MFKAFIIKYVQDMVKDEMTAVVSNPKLSMSSHKISLNIIERFFILMIDNKHARNMPILQSILRVSAGSINILCYSYCSRVENPDANNKRDESKVEIEIELEDKINRNKLIC